MDERGQIILRKRLSRHDLMPCIATLPPVLIGMEACGGAHDWARRFRAHGHEVKRMAPQFVKLYVLVASFPERKGCSPSPWYRTRTGDDRGLVRKMRGALWQRVRRHAHDRY